MNIEYALMSIRLAQRSDASQIVKVLYDSFYQTFRTDKNEHSVKAYLDTLNEDAILQMMVRDDTEFHLIEEERKILGFVQLLNESPHNRSKALKVERLYIDPGALGKGLGGQLMNHSIALAEGQGCEEIWLLVLRSNDRGVKFYEKIGFKTFDTSPGKFKEDAEIDLWMSKSLT